MTDKQATSDSTTTSVGVRLALKVRAIAQTLFTVAILATPLITSATWDDYTDKSLQSTMDENSGITDDVDIYLTPGLPQRALVTYTGHKRPIPEERKWLVRSWLKSIGKLREYGDLYQTEVMFTENGTTHWLPVQEPLIEHLENELSAGDKVWLYVVWIGTTKTEWVFIVNEFQKDIAQEVY